MCEEENVGTSIFSFPLNVLYPFGDPKLICTNLNFQWIKSVDSMLVNSLSHSLSLSLSLLLSLSKRPVKKGLKVALQILDRKFYKNTKKSSL